MIPKALELDIVTPDKQIVHDQVDEVQLPGWEGALGILPGHTPLLAMLKERRLAPVTLDSLLRPAGGPSATAGGSSKT